MTDAEKTLKVRELLRKRYATDKGWICLEELSSNQLHHVNGGSLCDMFCFCMWQSGGHQRIGIEIKVSRADLKHEVDNFGKSDGWFTYSNKWYLAIPDAKMVEGIDVPSQWGIIVVDIEKQRTRTLRDCPAKNAAFDEGLMAAMMLKLQQSSISRVEHDKEVDKRIKYAREDERRIISRSREDFDAVQDRKELENLRKIIDTFREKADIYITSRSDFDDIKKYAVLLRLFMNSYQSVPSLVRHLEDGYREYGELLSNLRKEVDKLD